VLGAFFYTPPQPPSTNSNLSTIPENEGYIARHVRKLRNFELGNPEYPGENRAVFVAVISRMIITPLLLLPFIAYMAKYDLFEAAEDPVFILAAVLLVSSVGSGKGQADIQPPALTLAQITQAASGDAFERLISKTISWSYAVLTPP
jgi:predicted permease